ncbi:HNH endonuclease [Streptomyces montanus]|uniref:HNH endonuclease n=1 Tax=Streptomyces montanus TaxID=2580423 RepID=A0A5R9FY35_9ACTN|nr:HNH endonuclease signature motif containing protein [Streptomyces montanus]TLS46906.1 HNH endonuclease [Streptomyces montanus]
MLLPLPTSRAPLPSWVRNAVLSAAGGWCTYCGSMGVRAEVVDHVVPLERGGADDITNLIPACRSCNASKKDRTPAQWKKSLERRHYNPRKWWDEPPCPDFMGYTDAGLVELVAEAQSEVMAAASPYQERAAAKMIALVVRLDANLRNLTPSQRKEVLAALQGLIDQYRD